MHNTAAQEEIAIHAGFPKLLYNPEAPAFFTYALFQMDQYGNVTLTRCVGVMLHLRMTSQAITFQQLNHQSPNLTFSHLIPCRNMDVITQDNLNETEDLPFATDNLDTNVFPHYLFYWGGVVIYYVCDFYAGSTALRLAFLNYANPVSHADKRSCFWRNATSKITTGPNYAISIRFTLHIKQVCGCFHSFHYVLVFLCNRCELNLNLVWKFDIIYI